jgi:uncharacterized protein YabN with tetrapyrrole methylase and pyrophosphatase domain
MEQYAREGGNTLYQMSLDELEALWVRSKES